MSGKRTTAAEARGKHGKGRLRAIKGTGTLKAIKKGEALSQQHQIVYKHHEEHHVAERSTRNQKTEHRNIKPVK